MTLGNTKNESTAIGNGTSTVFTFDFVVHGSDMVEVYTRSTSDASPVLVDPLDYTVTLYTSSDGGEIDFDTAPLTDVQIIIRRAPNYLQNTAFPLNRNLDERALEKQIDKLDMQDIDLRQKILRSIQLPFGTQEDFSGIVQGNPTSGSVPKIILDGTGKAIGVEWSSNDPDSAGPISIVSGSQVLATGSTTARSLANRFADVYNVKDFGAVGDGSTNDTVAIQAAITKAISTNGAVYFPLGVYMVSAPLTLTGSSIVRLFGNGKLSQIKCLSSFSGNQLLSVSSTGTSEVLDLHFDGNFPTTTGMASGDTRGLIEFTGAGARNSFRGCTISNTEANALLSSGTGQLDVLGNTFNTIGDFACTLHNTGGIIVSNNFVNGAGGGGIFINTYSFNTKADVPTVVTGNWVKDVTDVYFAGTGSRGNGIHVFNSRKVTISGNYCQNCEWSGIRTATCEFIDITGNVLVDNGETGIWSEFRHEYNSITGNIVYGYGVATWGSAATSGVPGISCVNLLSNLGRSTLVANNSVVLGRGTGILIEGDVHCTGNFIDSCSYGIVSGTNQYAKDNFITGNRITDRAAPAWANSTSYRAGSRVTANGNVYYTAAGGTSDSSGTGPSGTGTGIVDGTVTWDYLKLSHPLLVGILVTRNTSALGYTFVTNNVVLDATTATIAPGNGNPMVLSTWAAGSKVLLAGNIPGILATYLPTDGMPGGLQYVTDTPALKFYNGTNWCNLNYLTGSTTWDPGSLADGAGETSTGITVTGAAFGDFVDVAAPYDLQGITCNGYVSAADTIKIRIQNETGGTIDLASGTWSVRVSKP